MKTLPDHLPRKCIIEAIHAYDAGIAHQFKPARLYEVEFEGRRYPSKAIVGIAATLMTGVEFTPADFSGGVKSKCVRLLTEQGFRIIHGPEENDPAEEYVFPDEWLSTADFVEGAAIQVLVNRYERDRRAREAAIRYHGCACKVCGLDMEKQYGNIGKGFIHVHHLVPLSAIKQDYQLNPNTDLIPVCPNCHAMLHRTHPPLTPQALQRLLQENKRS
ncbi:HNH endonuclease [Klebsiella sp. R445]